MELGQGLSLIPLCSVTLTFTRVENSAKSVDEWQLKETVSGLLRRHVPAASVKDKDIIVRREKDPKNPIVAVVTIQLWENAGGKVDSQALAESIVKNINGLTINLGGIRLKCAVTKPEVEDLEDMVKAWQKHYGQSTDYNSRKPGERPDTLIIKKLPSRWLSDSAVASSQSTDLAHTVFSKFGAIRNLELMGDQDLKKAAKELAGSGAGPAGVLQCEVRVQFKEHSGFLKAMETFGGRAMCKAGSTMVANYELHWDKEGYFSERSIHNRKMEKEREESLAKQRAFEERRRLAVEARKAELAMIEQRKREAEEQERLKKEEEERRAREEEEARLEEERLRLEEEERLREEEEMMRLEEEQREREEREAEERRVLEEQLRREREEAEAIRREEERKRMEEEERRREEREKQRKRAEAEEELQRLEERQRRLQSERSRRTTEQRLRDHLVDNLVKGGADGQRASGRRQGGDGGALEDRWRLDVTQSAASILTQKALAEGVSCRRASVDTEEETDEDEGRSPFGKESRKRLYSTIALQ